MITGSVVLVTLTVYTPKQGILSISLSQPSYNKWVPGRNLFMLILERLNGSGTKARIIMSKRHEYH